MDLDKFSHSCKELGFQDISDEHPWNKFVYLLAINDDTEVEVWCRRQEINVDIRHGDDYEDVFRVLKSTDPAKALLAVTEAITFLKKAESIK